jgi:hypothetical protein
MITAPDNRHPGDAEATAAIAGMAETYGYQPAPGDRVSCERPFRGDYAEGEVVATNGVYVMVELDGERLAYYPHELRLVSRAT